jgi:hypothetical protein
MHLVRANKEANIRKVGLLSIGQTFYSGLETQVYMVTSVGSLQDGHIVAIALTGDKAGMASDFSNEHMALVMEAFVVTA